MINLPQPSHIYFHEREPPMRVTAPTSSKTIDLSPIDIIAKCFGTSFVFMAPGKSGYSQSKVAKLTKNGN
jgi:hypothetical protein